MIMTAEQLAGSDVFGMEGEELLTGQARMGGVHGALHMDRKGVWNMKSSSLNTHMGNISIDNEVIAQYAGSVAVECFGIVGMAGVNVRDGVFSLLKKESMTRGINVSLTPEGKLIIDFHVIVSYGVNIPTVADNLIESVRYRVEEFTGLEIEKMNVFVEGVKVID